MVAFVNMAESTAIGHEFIPSALALAPADTDLDIGSRVDFQVTPLPYQFSLAATFMPGDGEWYPLR